MKALARRFGWNSTQPFSMKSDGTFELERWSTIKLMMCFAKTKLVCQNPCWNSVPINYPSHYENMRKATDNASRWSEQQCSRFCKLGPTTCEKIRQCLLLFVKVGSAGGSVPGWQQEFVETARRWKSSWWRMRQAGMLAADFAWKITSN